MTHSPTAIPGDGVSSAPRETSLSGKRVAMVVFSSYPLDPRPRRAAEALVRSGASVELISLRTTLAEAKSEDVDGVAVRRVAVAHRRGGRMRYLYEYLAFIAASSWIVAARSLSRRYDLVYVHNMPDVLVVAGLIPKLFGAKIVLDLHDPMPELMRSIFGLSEDALSVSLLKFLEKWSMRLADSVVTVNEACAKVFASRSCPAEKITVVMNTPDESIFRFRERAPSGNGRRGFVLMYHGSLVERNGLGLAVEALGRLNGSIPNLEFRVYGNKQDGYLERVMDSVRERGLEDVVHLLGLKSAEEIADAIVECDIGIIPNQRNTFTDLNTPTRILEYLSMGKPAIAPRSAGICDYFDETSLIMFEPGDAGELAEKILHAYRNPEETAAIASRGRAVYRAHTWQEERMRLIALVTRLVGGRGAGSAGKAAEGYRKESE